MTLEHARQYFARVVPWPQDGEAPFYLNVHWTSKPPDRDKPFWTGRATRTVSEAVKTVEWAMTLPETRDVYLCLSSQRTAQTKTSQKGRDYLIPMRSSENAVALKSLFLDIDIKPDSGYGTSPPPMQPPPRPLRGRSPVRADVRSAHPPRQHAASPIQKSRQPCAT